MAEIEVQRRDVEQFMSSFEVTVTEGPTSTHHHVTLSGADYERLASGERPETFVRRCFEFLLAREPKESILPSFDVSEIARLFRGFEREIGRGGHDAG